MAMKPVLALKLGQQLRMTPQLQQAIKLLQLSTFDLQQEIQEALDSNLMLEEATPDDADNSNEETSHDTPDETIEGQQLTDAKTTSDDFNDEPISNPEIDGDAVPDTSDQLASDSITEELPVDSVWEDVWDEAPPPSSYSGTDEDGDNYLENQNSSSVSLQTHLAEQLNLLSLSDTDQVIAMAILDGLEDDGVLSISIEDILLSIPTEIGEEIEADEVEAVLHLIQHLDPVGVAARDLSECLTIQLNQLPADGR